MKHTADWRRSATMSTALRTPSGSRALPSSDGPLGGSLVSRRVASCAAPPQALHRLAPMQPKRIGLVGFEGVTALHLVGRGRRTLCRNARRWLWRPHSCYDVWTLGVESERFHAESGVAFTARATSTMRRTSTPSSSQEAVEFVLMV